MSFLTRHGGLSTRCHSIGPDMPVTLRRNVNHTQNFHQLCRGPVYALFVWIWYDYTWRTKLLLAGHDEMTSEPTNSQRQNPVPAHGRTRFLNANRGFCMAWAKQCNRNCLRPRNQRSVVHGLTLLVLRTEYRPVWRRSRLCCGAIIRISSSPRHYPVLDTSKDRHSSTTRGRMRRHSRPADW